VDSTAECDQLNLAHVARKNVKKKKWFNPVWHRMFYSCTHMTTVGVKGLNNTTNKNNKARDKLKSTSSGLELALMEATSRPSRMPRFISSSSRTSVTLIVLCNFTRMCMKTSLNVLDSSSSCRHSTAFLSGRKKPENVRICSTKYTAP